MEELDRELKMLNGADYLAAVNAEVDPQSGMIQFLNSVYQWEGEGAGVPRVSGGGQGSYLQLPGLPHHLLHLQTQGGPLP